MTSSDVSLEYALADAAALKGLSNRESELVRKAGERVFELSRKAAEREREVERLALDIQHLQRLLEETVRSREVLTNQVRSMQIDAERGLEERSELRRLLAGAQAQVQQLLASLLAPPTDSSTPEPRRLGTHAPQRDSRGRRVRSRTPLGVTFSTDRIRGWLGRS